MKSLSAIFCLFFCGLLISPNAVAAKVPTAKEFAQTYQKNLKTLRKNLNPPLLDPCQPETNFDSPVDISVHFVPEIALAEFCATQTIYSYYKIAQELKKSKPSKKTVDYVFYRGRRYLVDGHHHILLAIYNGEKTIPAQVVHYFPDSVTPEEFLKIMKDKNFLYDQFIDPLDMTDDPYLNKVRELIRDTAFQGPRLMLKGRKQTGPMIGALAPEKAYFAEQRLAEILEESGYILKNIDGEKLIEIFLKAKKANDPRVENLILLDKPFDIEDYKDFEEAQKLIRAKYRKLLFTRRCSQWLLPDNLP